MPNKIRALLPGLFFAIFSVLFLHTAWVKSPTWDEVGHIGLGAYLLKTGRWDVPASCSHPPLAFYLHSPPSFVYPLDWSRWRYRADALRDIRFLRSADTQRGNAMLLDQRYDGERFFFWSRTTSLLLAIPLFAALYSWSRELCGYWGALLTLFFAALSPNLLAHATLINTDFTLAATFFCTIFAYRRLLLYPSPAALVIAGLALGLALMSKLSALVLLPVLLAITLWFFHFSDFAQRQRVARLFGHSHLVSLAVAYLGVCFLAILALWASYGFNHEPYILTVRSQLWDIGAGHAAYLMGQFSDQGWWYYFPLAIAIKTPIPTLVLAIWGLWALARRRPTLELGFVLWPPLLLIGLFVLGNAKNIGLRYLLGIYPFLFLLVGATMHSALRSWKIYLLCLFAVFYAISTTKNHPHHLAYFNELIGGPEQGYHYLVDSNIDWGQDLKGLKSYMDEKGIERIKLSYFGAVDPRLYDLKYEWLPGFKLPNLDGSPAKLPTTGTIAISVTNLTGVYMDMYDQGRGLYTWLQAHQPVAHIGHSIFIYEIE